MRTEDPFVDRLSEYLDGELDASETARVDAHLRACGHCRSVLDDLRAVARRAAALSDTAPTADLWPGVASRIDAAGPAAPLVTPFRRRPAVRRFSFTLPQIVAASLALIVLSGGIVWMARSGDPGTDFPQVAATPQDAPDVTPANFAEPQFDQAIADLERILEEGRSKLDPETVRVLEANLETIDRAIDQCRRALAAEPGNTYLNNHLASARQRKLTLLRRATALTI